MNQALLSGIASKAYDKLLKAAESKQPIAVTGLPDTMAAYIASKLCADTGKKVLLISGNDLKAAHDAEDGQQLLESGVACLPGGEIDLTRGASSHESAWRRLEALAADVEADGFPLGGNLDRRIAQAAGIGRRLCLHGRCTAMCPDRLRCCLDAELVSGVAGQAGQVDAGVGRAGIGGNAAARGGGNRGAGVAHAPAKAHG